MKKMELPELPHGQGSMDFYRGKIRYRKRHTFPDGSKKNITVIEDTVQKCFKAMETKIWEEEKTLSTVTSSMSLSEAMINWLNSVKHPVLKPQSFSRLESTIRNQILSNTVSDYAYQQITTNQLQCLINGLNDEKYSKSTIKKTYDALNDFYRYAAMTDSIKNPMLPVKMPINANIKAETKEIEFFEQEDIERFVGECGKLWNTGRPRYPFGYALGANIYLGLRIGELLALTWKDVDFQKKTVYVSKTVIEIRNQDYDEDDQEKMKELNIPKNKLVIQHSTKKSKNRYVPMNTKALSLMEAQYKRAKYKGAEDLVICSDTKHIKSIKDVSDTIKRIEKAAETEVQSSGTHTLRHTCASLYFRKGVPIETICQILGNTREVCEKTYIHFIEEQLQEAASKITAIEV